MSLLTILTEIQIFPLFDLTVCMGVLNCLRHLIVGIWDGIPTENVVISGFNGIPPFPTYRPAILLGCSYLPNKRNGRVLGPLFFHQWLLFLIFPSKVGHTR